MSREAIEVGAFTWSRIQRLYDPDPTAHWQRCELEGLQCPARSICPTLSRAIEQRRLCRDCAQHRLGRRGLQEISGIAMRHVRVAREYQHAPDEARDQATRFGIVDERQEVVDHWRDARSWIVPPVAVACDLLGGGAGREILIGYTRLVNLLALLDRE